jgi:hypothetical protein
MVVNIVRVYGTRLIYAAVKFRINIKAQILCSGIVESLVL